MLEKAFPAINFEIRVIKTTGDIDQSTPLVKIGEVGLFTRQLEKALEEREIDIAVHSLKDMPSVISERFRIAAVLERENPLDAFISERYRLEDLGRGISVGTGSLRRCSQLRHAFPTIKIEDLRGNVDTRLRKLREGRYGAIILACAGIERLGMGQAITAVIPEEICIPAVGQGVIAVEMRSGEPELEEVVSHIDHRPTRVCIEAERDFLRIVEGGCKVPVGCYARLEESGIHIAGFIGDLSGENVVRRTLSFAGSDSAAGSALARAMLDAGGGDILRQLRHS